MNARLYLETTIVSYLVARPSSNEKARYYHEMAKQWWDKRLTKYKVCVSESLFTELETDGIGVPRTVKSQLDKFTTLPLTPAVAELSEALLRQQALPADASRAAKHIATAAVHGIKLLVSLDLHRTAHAHFRRDIEAVCRSLGYQCPAIGYPPQFMGSDAVDDPIVAAVRAVRRKLWAEHGNDPKRYFAHLLSNPQLAARQ